MLSDREFVDGFVAHEADLLRFIGSVLPKSIRSQVDAEDILQQTCSDAWRSRQQFRGRNLVAWLKRVARRNVIDATRLSHAQKRRGDINARRIAGSNGRSSQRLDVAGNVRTPSSEVASLELSDQLIMCLNRLPARYRKVITMRYLDCLPVRHVAGSLGITEPATYMLTKRALAELRKLVVT